MSLEQKQASLLHRGWVRALLLVVVYVGASVAVGMLPLSPAVWFTLNFIIAVVVVFVFRKYIDQKSFKSLGFDRSYMLPDVMIGLSQGILLVSAGSLLIYYLKGLSWADVSPDAQDLLGSFVLLLLIAFAEELVFRGYVLRNLMKSFNKWLALFISAAIFTVVHVANPGIPAAGVLNTFLGGLLFGILFISTRKLWLPVFFHFSWNFMQGPILGYPVSGLPFKSLFIMESNGNILLNGGSYGFEGSVVCSVFLALSFLGWGYFERKKSHAPY